jgi:hypothetical protein
MKAWSNAQLIELEINKTEEESTEDSQAKIFCKPPTPTKPPVEQFS